MAKNDKVYSLLNSNMVRLKAIALALLGTATIFQFQYGAIKRTKPMRSYCLLWNFNSNMVRLKENPTKATTTAAKISIPIWCD